MSDAEKTYGQIAYEAYSTATRGRSLVSAVQLPGWDGQEQAIQDAWQAAGEAIAADVMTRYGMTAGVDAERDQARTRIAELEAQLADGGTQHPSCDVHRWWAVVKHYGSFAYGFAASDDGLRVFDDVDEFEHAKAQDFG